LSAIQLSNSLAHNLPRAGDRNPVLRLRQGYGACTLLGAAHLLFRFVMCLFSRIICGLIIYSFTNFWVVSLLNRIK
jgi:hypothetical protein